MKAELETVGLKTSNIYGNLVALNESLRRGLGDLKSQLEELSKTVKGGQDSILQQRVLKDLEFLEMKSRFDNVTTLQKMDNSFQWIFRDPHMLREKERDLQVTFTEWLESGSDIFHIVGNPGSGKSTLMKYLWTEPKTEDLLLSWAKAAGRRLIFCQFFFWGLSTIQQKKTLRGLKQSLLHDVLLHSGPSLTERLLPRQWVAKGNNTGIVRRADQLDDGTISEAFEKLMEDRDILQEFRIFFLIDGLDEFTEDVKVQDQDENHDTLAEKLRTWAAGSGGHVKMCVSSRPLRAFKSFPVSQKITLQNLTQKDMESLVARKLDKNAAFCRLKNESDSNRERCATISRTILQDAQGVFLWVVLVLTQMDQALRETASPDLEMLETIVNRKFENLTLFFQDVLKSIPRFCQTGSYYLLAAMLRISGLVLSESKTSDEHRNVEHDVLAGLAPPHITLEDCKLIFQAGDRDELLSCDGKLAHITWDFSRDSKGQAVAKEDLLSRCRGLVEVNSDLNLIFTHRSIPEALREVFSKDQLTETVHDEKVAEILSWVVLAESKFWLQRRGQSGTSERLSSSPRTASLLACLRACDQEGSKKVFQLLQAIDGTILTAQFGTPTPTDSEWRQDILRNLRPKKPGLRRNWSILHDSRRSRLHEYVEWVVERMSPEEDRNQMLVLLGDLIFDIAGYIDDFSLASAKRMISKLKDKITLVSSLPQSSQEDAGCMIWHEFIAREVFFQATHNTQYEYFVSKTLGAPDFHWRGVEILLMFGADPEILFSHDKGSKAGVISGPAGVKLFSISPADFDLDFDFVALPTSPISLEDFIRHHKPRNMAKLMRLIEDNKTAKGGNKPSDGRTDSRIL